MSVFSVENDLIFVVIAPGPCVLCEEVLDVCGSVPQGRVGKIESGGHGGRVFLWGGVWLLWCSSLSSNLFCGFCVFLLWISKWSILCSILTQVGIQNKIIIKKVWNSKKVFWNLDGSDRKSGLA